MVRDLGFLRSGMRAPRDQRKQVNGIIAATSNSPPKHQNLRHLSIGENFYAGRRIFQRSSLRPALQLNPLYITAYKISNFGLDKRLKIW
jgi:hypothetical protein